MVITRNLSLECFPHISQFIGGIYLPFRRYVTSATEKESLNKLIDAAADDDNSAHYDTIINI
jgi:hypothetical protein